LRIKHFKSVLVIPLAFAIMFSLVFILPVSAGGVTSTPGGTTINVASGQTFLLRHELYFNQAGSGGVFALAILWVAPSSDENFTLENAPSIYWISGPENGLPVENVQWDNSPTLDGWSVGAFIDSTDKNYIDGHFYVDFWLRAASPDGTTHSQGTQDLNYGAGIYIQEGGGPSIIGVDNVTISVLGRGVSVSISPNSQSGAPGATLNYNVTVQNTGGLIDNYNLTVSDNAGFGGNLSIDNNRFENVQPNENRTTTLHVHIPSNSPGGTVDNIVVTATSQGDNTKSGSGSCLANVTIARGVQVLITPPSQENDNGGMLTFVITVKNTGNVQENFQMAKGDSAGWTLALDNAWLIVPNGENRTTKLTVNIPSGATGGTTDNIWVKATSKDNSAVFDNKSCLAHVKVSVGLSVSIAPGYQSGLPGATLNYTVTVINSGNASDTFNLVATDSAGWSLNVSPPSLTVPAQENMTATLSVTVSLSALGGTNDTVVVTATSQENSAVTDNASCTANAAIVLGVDVMISPGYLSGAPGSDLSYTVNVINNGNVSDNYDLMVSDNSGWSPTLDDNQFVNVAPGDNMMTTLRVTVPENAVPFTNDNIVVRATSVENENILAESSCIAHAALPLGVEVSISPDNQSGTPSMTLNYTVTVSNTGASSDTYDLAASDNSGWGPTVSPASLTVAAGENMTSTLSVTVPDNAFGGTNDNITVTATSQTDNSVSASDSCVARALGVLTELSTVIYPTADIYAYGEYGTGYSRTQLKFDISSIPLQGKILSAKLYLLRLAADGWDGNATVNRVNDQLWNENITASQFDAQALTDEESNTGKWTLHGWDYVDVSNQLEADFAASNTYASFRLTWTGDNESVPSIGIDDGRFLVIDSENNAVSLVLASSRYDGSGQGSDPYLEIVYVPPYAVSASISPKVESGQANDVLSYTVAVRNTGNLDDNYLLTVSDNSGWGPTISPTSIFVPSGSTGEATLTVTVPDNAAPGTSDNLIVTATSTGNPLISSSDSCIAHRAIIELKFATLYSVSVKLDIYLDNGSKLVLKFYKYGNYQAENTIWAGSTPAHAALFENVPHPLSLPVHEAKLVLTTDNTAQEIAILATLSVTHDDLTNRITQIILGWPNGSPSQQDAWANEINAIILNWFNYPS
jgi:uncharacterized membrane protein